MKKKIKAILAVASMMSLVLAINFTALKENVKFTDLNSITNIASAQAEGGRKCRVCDESGHGHGIPCWDRLCSDCNIHFNNSYGNTGYCWK